MTELLRQWITSLTGAALICAAAMALTPPGRVKRIVRMLCALVMAAALFAPLLRGAELSGYSLSLARYRAEADALTGEGETLRRNLDRGIIERETQAYIMDKARSLGAPLEGARVALRWSTEGVWLPASAELDGPFSAPLAAVLEAELGIPRAAQVWNASEDE